MSLRKVGLMGTRGRLGPFLLRALVDADLEVTVIKRAESSASLPSEYDGKVRTIELPSDFLNDQNGVAKLLEGLDAVVTAIPGSQTQEQTCLINSCVKAGVKRFIPADFGSVDSSDWVCIDAVPLYGKKKSIRDMLRGVSMMYPKLTWTSLVCGHFFDYGLETDLLGFDLTSSPPKAIIFDDGNKKWSASTRAQIGRALVAILEKPGETENRMLYIQSFYVSQNEVLENLERISGKKFELKQVVSEEYIKDKKEEFARTGEYSEELVGILGLTRADWTQKQDFANPILGLKEESLEDEVRKAWSASGTS